jgi:hypothetical protein
MGSFMDNWLRSQPFEKRADIERTSEIRENVEAGTVWVEAEVERMWHAEGEPGRHATRRVGMRVEEESDRTILRFVNGPTGHESFVLGRDFVACVVQDADEKFWICAGSARYEACAVPAAAILDFIASVRPDLVDEPASAPSF